MLGLRAIGQGSGGVEKAVEEISTRLAVRGHEVTVFCRGRYNAGPIEQFKGVRLVNLPAVYTKHLEAFTHSFLAAVRSTRGYDLVHVHAVGPALWSFIPRLAGRRVVVTVHAQDWRRQKWSAPARLVLRTGAWAAARFPHRTIVVSPLLQQYFKSTFGRDTVHIPNGVPAALRRPADRIRRFGVRGGDYVLFIGRFVPEKGAHLLVDAFRTLDTPLKLLMVGDASHSEGYAEQLRRRAGDDARILFTGPLYDEDKDEAYSNAACMVLPSTLEGMPIVLLEALSYGCPVLCSDIPENVAVLTPGDEAARARYAFLFQSGSVEDLRRQLAQVLAQPEEGAARARAAARQLVPRYSWDHIVEETEKVYAAALGGRVPADPPGR